MTPAESIAVGLITEAVRHVPELVGIIRRGLATEPSRPLVDVLLERLPEHGESAAMAAKLRAERGT